MYEKENDLPFHSGLIFCPSNEVIMAEAFLQAKERLPQLDALRLDLGRVCDMALAEAPVWNYLKVQAAVSGIRRLHGLPHIDRESKSRVEKIHSSARRLRRGLGRLRDRYKNLNCADFSVCDVKAAGELMSIVNAYVAHAYDSSFKTWLRWLSRV